MCKCMGAMDAQPPCQKCREKIGYMSIGEIENYYGYIYKDGNFYDLETGAYVGKYDTAKQDIVFDDATAAGGDGSKFVNFTQGVTNLSNSLVNVANIFRRNQTQELTPEQIEARRIAMQNANLQQQPQRRRPSALVIVAGLLVVGLIIYFATKQS